MVATTPSIHKQPWYSRFELGFVLPATCLAGLMLWSVTRSLIVANWAAGMDILMLLVIPAFLLGIIFARLPWMSAWLAHPLAAALGVAWVIQLVGPLLTLRVTEEFGAPIAARLDTWSERATEILLRAIVWLRILRDGGRGEDIMLFVVVVALLIWVLGYATSWLIFRSGRVWFAVALSGAVILINYTFTYPKPSDLFFTFLGSALLLMVFLQIATQQRHWQHARMEIPGAVIWRTVFAAAVVCAILVASTSTLPGTVSSAEAQRAWRVIRSPFSSLRERWQDAFSTINAPPGTSGSFTVRGVRVGGPRNLSDAVVMSIRAKKNDYWRAVAFDKYTGLNWQNTVGERARATLGVATAEQARTSVAPGVAPIQAELRAHQLVTQTVTLVQPRTDGLLMVGGQFGVAGIPTLIQHGFLTDSTGHPVPNFTETSSVVAEVPLEETSTYTISSYLSIVDERSLRTAGATYPEWVRSAYLQLPDTLPGRVRDRAREIVDRANAKTPYDQALAIQAYLRTLTYDESRPMPPDDQDWVDHFIFTTQRGYCDDFASAMVVMLRSLGVPARWSQGYAGGSLDPDKGEWVVRESIAHSWPEVYFPSYGWQRFEPTPAPYAIVPVRPALPPDDQEKPIESSGDISNQLTDPDALLRRMREREDELQGGDGGGDVARVLAERQAAARQRLIALMSGIAAIIAALILAAWGFLRWQLRGLTPAAAEYTRLTRLGHWAGIEYEEWYTPREYAEVVALALPNTRLPVAGIAAAYENELYRPDHKAGSPALQDWPAVRWALLGRMLARLFSPREPHLAK